MTWELCDPPVGATADFRVASQVTTDEGAPDIEIRGPETYILVEVKDRSDVGPTQLERYARLIESNSAPQKCLVLLTRRRGKSAVRGGAIPIGWFQVSEWIAEMAGTELDEVTSYLSNQFIGFLEAKGMAVKRVDWHMNEGLDQLMNLKALLREVLESTGAHRVISSYGSEYTGVAIPNPRSDSSSYYWFIVFSNPGELLFTTYNENVIPDRLSGWEVHDRRTMRRRLDLISESAHFFSRSLSSQREFLEDFARSCLADTTYEEQLAAVQINGANEGLDD